MEVHTQKHNKLLNIVNKLPLFCQPFLLDSSITIISRLSYAYDLLSFYEYLYHNHTLFKNKEFKEITLNDMLDIDVLTINNYLLDYIPLENKIEDNYYSSTASRKKACLSQFYNYLNKNFSSFNHNPIKSCIKIYQSQNQTIEILTIPEQLKLLEHIKTGKGLTETQLRYHDKNKYRDYALFHLLLDTGLKISEIWDSNIIDLDLNNCCINIERKNKEWVQIYFSDSTRNSLDDYLEFRENNFGELDPLSPLFITMKENRLSIRQIEELLKKYIKISVPEKLEQISIRNLRSSFAVTSYQLNPDLQYIKNNMGLKKSQSINKYALAANTEIPQNRNMLQQERHRIEKLNKISN